MISIYSENESHLLLELTLTEASMGSAADFKAELIQLFDKHRKKIILNMEHVRYIDSSFLGALVAVLKHLISFNSDIVLVGLRKDIAELFTLIRLDKVFKIYIDFDAALINY